jgi:hypothetical protein
VSWVAFVVAAIRAWLEFCRLKHDKLRHDWIAFITDQEGLMYSLSLEGSKISRIER